jgi:hypothetical protein
METGVITPVVLMRLTGWGMQIHTTSGAGIGTREIWFQSMLLTTIWAEIKGAEKKQMTENAEVAEI